MFQSYTRQTLDRDRWEALAKDSLFNQLDWLSLWETIGASPLFYLSSSTQSEEPLQAFSCLRFGSGVVARAQASVDGLTARFLWGSKTDFQIEDHVRDEIFRALKLSGRASASWVDYRRDLNAEKLPRGWQAEWIQTHRLDISAKTPVLSASTERHIKSAQERGAVVTEIENASQVGRCYELMQKTYQRFGRRRMYPPEFYRKLFDYSRQQRRIRWYICLVKGNIIGSLIALVEGNEALSWQPFIDRDQSAYKPAYALLSQLIADARKLQLGSINLGGSPPAADGLIAFKERFGASVFRYPVFVSRAAWYRLYKSFWTAK